MVKAMKIIRVIALVLLWCFTMGHAACNLTFNYPESRPYYYQYRYGPWLSDSYFDEYYWHQKEHSPAYWKAFKRCRNWQSHSYCKKRMYRKWYYRH